MKLVKVKLITSNVPSTVTVVGWVMIFGKVAVSAAAFGTVAGLQFDARLQDPLWSKFQLALPPKRDAAKQKKKGKNSFFRERIPIQ